MKGMHKCIFNDSDNFMENKVYLNIIYQMNSS